MSSLQYKIYIPIIFIREKLSYKDSRKFIYKALPAKREIINNFYDNIRKHAFGNQPDLLCIDKCGCFYCKALFSPEEINTYIQVNDNLFLTAICPYCNNSTVIPQHEDYVLNKQLLNNMQQHYFKN